MSQFDKYTFNLFDVCRELHGCVSGSGDGLADVNFAYRVEWLTWRLENFEKPQSEYDRAVRRLVVATLAECAGYLASLRQP